MTDDFGFGAAAREAKAKATARQEESVRAAEAKAIAEVQRLETAKAYLAEQVLPVLEEAKKQIEDEDISVRIVESEEYQQDGSQSLIKVRFIGFEIFDPRDPEGYRKRPNIGRTYIRFEYNGTELKLSAAWSSWASPIKGEPPELVVRGVKNAMDHFFSA